MNRLIVPIFLAVLGCTIWLAEPAEVQVEEMVVVEQEIALETNVEPVEPLFNISLSADLQELVYNECMARGIDPYLAVAVMLRENYY
ncbi:MAG: hypothetical protein IIV02_06665, partial [Peptococcaceae bacterium]|nr:hypothetical protein [Peptococcaceae bacterium]